MGGYHCHRGPLAGQHFSSQNEMLRGLNTSRSKPAEPQEKKTDRACVIEDGTGRTVCGVLVEEMSPTSPGPTKKGKLDLPYDRLLYGSWVDEDGDCQNTRAEVLIRDNDFGVVEFKTLKQCHVVSGTWFDPYTGEVFQEASQLDIDHVVPLKNAHQSGAWAWSPEKKA